MNLLESIARLSHYVESVDRYTRQRTNDPSEPNSDRYSSGYLLQQELQNQTQIITGRVVDSIAYTHWYKVQLEGARTTMPCCMLSNTALTPFGVREHNQLHPNAIVYVIKHKSNQYGVILGVEPQPGWNNRKSLSDFVSLCSSHNLQTQQAHSHPFTLKKRGGLIDWSNGRPADGTCAGEWGMFAETAVGLFVDSAMAFVRADENCGAWFFYRDQLARVAGHNLQIRTGGSELEAMDDEGEFNIVEGSTPYPWENLGATTAGQTISRTLSAQENQISTPWYSAVEPLYDDIQPIHRTIQAKGYAGQGGKTTVAAPPKDQDVNRYSKQSVIPGMFESSTALTGAHVVQSAKGIRIIKRNVFPVAKRIKRPEDDTGDKSENYKAASQFGSGDSHKVTDFQADTDVKVLGQLDGQSYASTWESAVGQHYHKKDLFFPSEEQVKSEFGTKVIEKIPFDDLVGEDKLEAPDPQKIRIDHRYGEVEVYGNCSVIDMLDSGSIVIADGFGSSIVMSEGHITIAPAGDLILAPGRRLLVNAGRDISVRARENIELSTTEKDVRIRSKRNMEISAEDGMLLESKSEEIGWDGWKDNVGEDVVQHGITLKAKESSLMTLSTMAYIRTTGEEQTEGLTLDAAHGPIYCQAGYVEQWIEQTNTLYFGTEGSSTSTIELGSESYIGGNVSLNGALVTNGDITIDGWLRSTSGHVSTALAEQYEKKFEELKDSALEEQKDKVDAVSDKEEELKRQSEEDYTAVWDDFLYAEDGPGDEELWEHIGFSFRTTEQYKAETFAYYEQRWQQMARIWGSGKKWEEEPSPKSNQDTYPFPGQTRFEAEDGLKTLDLKLFDLDTGLPKDRGSVYEEPEYSEIVPKSLSDYKVIE